MSWVEAIHEVKYPPICPLSSNDEISAPRNKMLSQYFKIFFFCLHTSCYNACWLYLGLRCNVICIICHFSTARSYYDSQLLSLLACIITSLKASDCVLTWVSCKGQYIIRFNHHKESLNGACVLTFGFPLPHSTYRATQVPDIPGCM